LGDDAAAVVVAAAVTAEAQIKELKRGMGTRIAVVDNEPPCDTVSISFSLAKYSKCLRVRVLRRCGVAQHSQ